MDANSPLVRDLSINDESKSINEQNSKVSPRSKNVLFFAQILIIFTIVLASIINLSISNTHTDLWIALTASCLGSLMPGPKLRHSKKYKTKYFKLRNSP